MLYVLENVRARITLKRTAGEQGSVMKEKSGVLLVWRLLLAGLCVLLLVMTAGLVSLLLQQKEMSEELLRLESQVEELSESCRLRATIFPAELAENREMKKLHRSRRNKDEELTRSQEQKDALTLMTYSMVPVRHLSILHIIHCYAKDNRYILGSCFFITTG